MDNNDPNYKTTNHNHCSVGTAELYFWEVSIESTIFGRLWHEGRGTFQGLLDKSSLRTSSHYLSNNT